jgi:hypothetical protein
MLSMFMGPDGKVSMMRVSTMIIVFSVVGVFVAHNILSMIRGGVFISFGASEALLLAGALGMKSVQSFSENKKSPGSLSDNVMPTP